MSLHQASSHPVKENKLLIFYYFIASLGLSAIFYRLGGLLGEHYVREIHHTISFYTWASLCMETEKPAQMLGYVIPTAALFIFYFLAQFHLNRPQNFNLLAQFNHSHSLLNSYFILGLLLSILIFVVPDRGFFVGLSFGWLLLMIFPFLNEHRSTRYYYLSWSLLIATLLGALFIALQPYLSSRYLLVSNDYMDIPESTRMADGQYVDNTQFINQNRIGGLKKYDPRKIDDLLNLQVNQDYIKLTKTPALLKYVDAHAEQFSYDDKLGALFVNQKLLLEDKGSLCEIVGSKECRAIDEYFNFSNSLANRRYTSEQVDFIKKNAYELFNQAAAGHYFHHHHAFLGVMNEYNLGKPVSQIGFLYGWLNTVTMAKLAGHHSVLSFANYIKITYLCYPLYFLFVALAAMLLFRNIFYVTFIVLCYAASLFLIGFESIHLAPGFNPMRHLLDMPVLMSWYGYLFAKRKNSFYLAAALLFAVLAFFSDHEFGLFIAAGLFFTSIFYFFMQQKRKYQDGALWLLAVVALVAGTLLVKTGKSGSLIYSLIGISTPEINFLQIACLLGVLCVFQALVLLSKWHDQRWKYIAIYLLVYAQASLVYYVWYSESGHLLVFASTWIFLTAILLREKLRYSSCAAKENLCLFLLTMIIFVVGFAPSALSYQAQQEEYLNVFKNHRVYYWDMPTANFVSTMDPAPFKNAIDLIHQYSDGNGIYLISKYDNFLPFLAQRYSMMPFLQVDLSLVTQKEMQIAANAILQNKPKFLFVDTDIHRIRQGDIYWRKDPINGRLKDIDSLSYGRFLVLKNLSQLFDLVESDYVPIARGQLITVYKLKDADKNHNV